MYVYVQGMVGVCVCMRARACVYVCIQVCTHVHACQDQNRSSGILSQTRSLTHRNTDIWLGEPDSELLWSTCQSHTWWIIELYWDYLQKYGGEGALLLRYSLPALWAFLLDEICLSQRKLLHNSRVSAHSSLCSKLLYPPRVFPGWASSSSGATSAWSPDRKPEGREFLDSSAAESWLSASCDSHVTISRHPLVPGH